jgi:hypothetical protein
MELVDPSTLHRKSGIWGTRVCGRESRIEGKNPQD